MRARRYVTSDSTARYTAKGKIHGKKLLLCIWWDQLGVVYYGLLKPNETIAGTVYRTKLLRLIRALKEKGAHYYSRRDKIILLHDNARPHVAAPVKTYLEILKCLKWEVLPHPPYSPDIGPSDFHLFRSMTHGLSEQQFTSYENTKNWVDSWTQYVGNQKMKHSSEVVSVCCQKDGKK